MMFEVLSVVVFHPVPILFSEPMKLAQSTQEQLREVLPSIYIYRTAKLIWCGLGSIIIPQSV